MTAADLEAKLWYETAPGMHTYHPCACGRATRAGWCWRCLADEYRTQHGPLPERLAARVQMMEDRP
jgi:hypothetical protein